MKVGSLTSIVLVGGVVAATACATASGDVTGGLDRFDAAAPAFVPPASAAQTCDIDGDSGTGSTWSDLYRDFFGPTGKASCAGDGACHGDATQEGAKTSGGYVCAGDKAACRASLLSEDTGLVQLPRDQAAPDKSGLVQELRRRKDDGTVVGLMPKRPACIFEPAAIQRIEDWITAGAPDN